MKIGLDFHGVIDTYPQVFGPLSKILMASGHEVYVITGQQLLPVFLDQIVALGIEFTSTVSITDYHLQNGTGVRYDEKGEPWIDAKVWDSTKALLCDLFDIDFHIDDSEVYGAYFTGKTKYILLKKENKDAA